MVLICVSDVLFVRQSLSLSQTSVARLELEQRQPCTGAHGTASYSVNCSSFLECADRLQHPGSALLESYAKVLTSFAVSEMFLNSIRCGALFEETHVGPQTLGQLGVKKACVITFENVRVVRSKLQST